MGMDSGTLIAPAEIVPNIGREDRARMPLSAIAVLFLQICFFIFTLLFLLFSLIKAIEMNKANFAPFL